MATQPATFVAIDIHGDGDIGALSIPLPFLTLSRPPSYMVDRSAPPTPSGAACNNTTAQAHDTEAHIPKDNITLCLRRLIVYIVILLWGAALITAGLLPFFVDAVHPYALILGLPFVVTLGVGVVMCILAGKRADEREWQERRRREELELERRRRRELPEGCYFVIDEEALGHGHAVVTLLPPPPKYEDGVVTEGESAGRVESEETETGTADQVDSGIEESESEA